MVCKLLALCVITKCFITKCFITAFALPEIIKVLVSHKEVKFIHAVKFNQDPVEAFLDSKGQEDNATTILLLSSIWRIHKL